DALAAICRITTTALRKGAEDEHRPAALIAGRLLAMPLPSGSSCRRGAPGRNCMKSRRLCLPGCLAAAALSALAQPAAAGPTPPGAQVSNLEVLGFTGLDGRPGAFKLGIKHAANDHWYLYAGHTFDQGWSIIDVTDPKNPRYVKFIPYSTPTKEVLTAQVTVH